jgi:regulatory protein
MAKEGSLPGEKGLALSGSCDNTIMKGRRSKPEEERAERTAYDRGLSMLARREHSRRELRARLEHGGCDEAEARDAIKRLGDQNYQNDERFGEMLLRARLAHGYGPARIRAELLSHGLKAAGIDALIRSAEVDWNALALAQLRKKYGTRPAADHAERGKRAQFLLRRGFAAATVRAVTHAEVD